MNVAFGASGDRLGIEVVNVLRDSQAAGDVQLRVSAESGRFVGANTVWVGRDQAESFVSLLRRFDVDLTGSAVVGAMSPGEFELRVGRADRAGHIQLRGFVGEVRRAPGLPLRSNVEFGITIDPSELRHLLRFWEGIVAS